MSFSNILNIMTDPFLDQAIIIAALLGLMCGAISVLIICKHLSFIGEGVGHGALLGVAVASLLGIDLRFVLPIFGIIFSIGVGIIQKNSQASHDSIMAVFFSLCLGVGIVILSFQPSFGIKELLFGNLLFVDISQIVLLCALSIITISLLWIFYRPLIVLLLDEHHAKRVGVPALTFNIIILALIGAVVSCSIQVVGVLLTTTLLVAPGLISLQWSRKINTAFIASSFIGVAVSTLGVIFSYVLDTPPGASIAALGGSVFLISSCLKRIL